LNAQYVGIDRHVRRDVPGGPLGVPGFELFSEVTTLYVAGQPRTVG
jgi:hypothetical protein